jgi:superfamily II DNA or RNA helicase
MTLLLEGNHPLSLEDFLPGYPDFDESYQTPDFDIYDSTDIPEQTFLNKQEFTPLPASELKPDRPGIPLIHQLNSARFLSPQTLNDEILLFDGLGSGKTCSAVTIAEQAKQVNPTLKQTLVLVKGPPLKRNFVQELVFRCTSGKFIPDNYENLTKGEKIIRMNRLINKEYDIHTFETFAEEVSKYSNEHIHSVYSNRVIIIDEVHRIPKSIYKHFHRFFHLLENRKIVLLSATPMRDQPEEFANVMNLILPIEKQLPTGREFLKKFFMTSSTPDEDSSDHSLIPQLKNIQELKDKIRGRIGYIRSMESGVKKMFEGELYRTMKKILIYPTTMSDFQTKYYIEAYKSDIGETERDIKTITEDDESLSETQGLYSKSRQASLFVYPDGVSTEKKGSSEKKGFSKYIELIGTTDFKLSNVLKKELTDNGKATPFKIIQNIEKYSSIYSTTLKEILNHPEENTFVYNKFVQGSGGILFSQLLKLLGFQRTRGNITDLETLAESSDSDTEEDEESESEEEIIRKITKKSIKRVPRFALLIGKITAVEIDRIIEIFNSPQNKHGEIIQVLIGSQVIGEGKSFKNVRQIHIQTPHWNNPETEQAIGRGIRAFSHDDLSPEERYVKIFRHASIPKDETIESINFLMYKISEDKEFKIKAIERVVKEISVNCALNWERNNLPTDKDGSRECDYTKCEYTCDYATHRTGLISDTYNLLYADTEAVKTIVKNMFRKKFSYGFNEIQSKLHETHPMVVIKALKELINQSVVIENRYGLPSYLREEKNLYFLVDDITAPNSFLMETYCEHPNLNKNYNFEDIIKIAQNTYIEDITVYLENFASGEDDKTVSDRISFLAPNLQELFIEKTIEAEKKNIKTSVHLRKILLEYYRNYITETEDGKTVSTFFQDYFGKSMCMGDDFSWSECDEDIEKDIEEKKIKEKISLENNPFRYYGMISKAKKFKIKEVKPKQKDSRKDSRGYVCITKVPATEIISVINTINKDDLNVKPPINVVIKDRKRALKELSRKVNKKMLEDLKKLDDDSFNSAYYWNVKASKKDLCDSLEKWFRENNLIMYE